MDTVEERSIDSLSNLEERITRAVQVITELRTQNTSLTKRIADLEAQNAAVAQERSDLVQKLKQQGSELDEFRGERKEVRTRIEKLLSQLDLLSAS